MMDDYIKREDAINAVADMLCFDAQPQTAGTCTRLDFIDDAKDWIDECQSADVAPVRHGRWIDDEEFGLELYYAKCSLCGRFMDVHENGGYYNYCPNCGAKMDEVKDAE